MSEIWHFYWPVLSAAAVIGLIAGTLAFRQRLGNPAYGVLAGGAAIVLLLSLAWSYPGGAEKRFTFAVERAARVTLDNYEMTQVTGRLERDPVRRTLVLSGPGNDFQQRELLRIMILVPGVGKVHWDRPIAPEQPRKS